MNQPLWAGLSDIGQVRRTNQDRCAGHPDRGLYIVADGVGGGPAGDVAAQLVVDLLPTHLAASGGATNEDRLRTALAEVSEQVRRHGSGTEREGMGSTVVAAVVGSNEALVGHLGDSRVYLLSGGDLRQVTTDHTYAEELIASGDVTREKAATVRSLRGLSRYAGMPDPTEPGVVRVPFHPGDRLLLCSDGLTNMVDGTAITNILAADLTPAGTCRELVALANLNGGKDNITVLVVEQQTPPTREHTAQPPTEARYTAAQAAALAAGASAATAVLCAVAVARRRRRLTAAHLGRGGAR